MMYLRCEYSVKDLMVTWEETHCFCQTTPVHVIQCIPGGGGGFKRAIRIFRSIFAGYLLLASQFLSLPLPLPSTSYSIPWPIRDPILVAFGNIVTTFWLQIFPFLNSFFHIFLNLQILKMCNPILVSLSLLKIQPHYSQSSHKNRTWCISDHKIKRIF